MWKVRGSINVGRRKSRGHTQHSFQALRLSLSLAGVFCKWPFIKARTKQEHGSLAGPTRKDRKAGSAGLKPDGVGTKVIVWHGELNGFFVNTASCLCSFLFS